MATRLTPAALRGLAVALDAGVGLGTVLQDRALSALLPAAARAALGRALREDVGPGEALRRADFLDEGEAAILDAGAEAGSLPAAFTTLAALREEAEGRRRRLLGAVAYPAFVVMAACVVLPLPVVVTGGVGAWARAALPGLSVVGGLLALVFIILPRSGPATQARVRGLLARLPVVGAVVVDDARAAGLGVLQRLLSSGVPLSLALPRALSSTGLPRFAARAAEAGAIVAGGGTLSGALSAVGLAVGDVAARLEIAERTGRLDEVLGQLAPALRAAAGRRFVVVVVALAVGLGVVVAVAIGWQIVSGFTGYLDTVDRVGRD